jgi:hypothetical protein
MGTAVQGMTVDYRGCFHVHNETNIYTYKSDGSYSISNTFTKVYGIAAGNDTVYALVNTMALFYLYQYNKDTGQWTDSGINISSITGTFRTYCLFRDNATEDVFLAELIDPITTFYRIPGLGILGIASGDNTSFYSAYSNEGFTFSNGYGLCSTQRGTLALPPTSFIFTAMDSDNIFWGDGASTIYRYNSNNGLTSKTVSLPHAAIARIIPLDGSRVIVSEDNAVTCDIFLYDYNTGEVIKTLYSYTTNGSGGARWASVYR